MNLVEILYMTRLVVVLMMVIVKQSNGLTCYRTDEDVSFRILMGVLNLTSLNLIR